MRTGAVEQRKRVLLGAVSTQCIVGAQKILRALVTCKGGVLTIAVKLIVVTVCMSENETNYSHIIREIVLYWFYVEVPYTVLEI
jgi:hypothetical protein